MTKFLRKLLGSLYILGATAQALLNFLYRSHKLYINRHAEVYAVFLLAFITALPFFLRKVFHLRSWRKDMQDKKNLVVLPWQCIIISHVFPYHCCTINWCCSLHYKLELIFLVSYIQYNHKIVNKAKINGIVNLEHYLTNIVQKTLIYKVKKLYS
jgi:hypothetical protein